jgi:DNA-binding Lrp family transcriptional regulator
MADKMSDTGGSGAPSAGRPARPLDAVDRRLLDELSRDARVSVRTLAERLHVSRTNAYARLERLLSEGVITGFGVRISPTRAGLGTSAYVSLAIEQNSWREVSRRLAAMPHVEHVALIGGDFDVLVLVRTPDNATLREVVLERLQGLPGVTATRTWLIFEEIRGPGPSWADL